MRIVRAWPLILAAALALAPGRAGAQHRGGGGFGGRGGGFGGFGGFGLYYYSPAQPEPLLYQRAMLNASRATMGPVMHNNYGGHPASYIYHMHDPGYLDGLDVATRRQIEARVARYSDGPPPPELRAAAPWAQPAPVAPRAQAAPAEAVPPAPRDSSAPTRDGAKP